MQDGTKTRLETDSNAEIHDLAAIRLSQEPWRWRKAILASKLPAGTKIAALAIVEFVNRKSGHCFASYETIAQTCDMTERGVRAAVLRLREAGLIRVVQRGAKRTNMIFLALPVTGTAQSSDRHHGDKVTVTTVPPNLRDNLLERTFTDRLSLELPASDPAKVLAFDKEVPKTTTDHVVRAADSAAAATTTIGTVAIQVLGYDLDCPKCPDGRYLDRVIVESLPRAILANLVQKNRSGLLMRSDVAEAVLGAGFAPRAREAA